MPLAYQSPVSFPVQGKDSRQRTREKGPQHEATRGANSPFGNNGNCLVHSLKERLCLKCEHSLHWPHSSYFKCWIFIGSAFTQERRGSFGVCMLAAAFISAKIIIRMLLLGARPACQRTAFPTAMGLRPDSGLISL